MTMHMCPSITAIYATTKLMKPSNLSNLSCSCSGIIAENVTYRTLFQVPVLATTTVGEELLLSDLTTFSITFSILSKTTSLNKIQISP